MTAAAHRKALVKLLQQCSSRRHLWEVFSDFVELAALSVANAVDLHQAPAREERYLRIVKGYEPGEVALFPQMLAELVNALEAEPHDALGMVFGELELGNAARGQFFTPYSICKLMADLSVDVPHMRELIASEGFITVMEPAVGAGAMVIAFADAMSQAGFNRQQHLHVTAIDVDARAAHMAFLQFSLLGIPAVVIVGNTLTLEERECFFTPAHVLGGWAWRLRARDARTADPEASPLTAVSPMAEGFAADASAQLPLFTSEAA